MISQKILEAINLSSHLHRNHFRHDDNNTPYVSHLYAVSMYIYKVTDDEDIIIAGLMHDSLEDVAEYTYEDLSSECGELVANIVMQVTENKALPYKERKLAYIENIKNGGVECLIVSLADKIHNSKSYNSLPEDKKHTGHMWLYGEILALAKNKLETEPDIYNIALPLIQELENAISGIAPLILPVLESQIDTDSTE